jgi:hypothetical protein
VGVQVSEGGVTEDDLVFFKLGRKSLIEHVDTLFFGLPTSVGHEDHWNVQLFDSRQSLLGEREGCHPSLQDTVDVRNNTREFSKHKYLEINY